MQGRKEVSVEFWVSKMWLAKKEYLKESIELNRYEKGLWLSLPTTQVREDTYRVTYKASSPGLSLFAIAAQPDKKQFIPIKNESQEPMVERDDTVLPKEEKTKSRIGLWLVLLVIVLSAIGTYFYVFTDLKERLRKKPKEEVSLVLETTSLKKPESSMKLPPNFDELCKFVKQCLDRGIADERIKSKLEAKGWDKQALEEALKRCKSIIKRQ